MFPALHALAPGEAEPSLEIRLFGSMEVRIGPRPLPRLRSRKGLWLLALLALREGRSVERSWLAGTLWPDCSEARALRSLRQSLHDSRLVLGPEAGRLTGEGPRMLRLDVDGAAVDVLAFDAAIARGDPASLEAATALYRGCLLEECAEAWVMGERLPREHAYVAALERLGAAAMARREPAAAAHYLRLAVGVDPCQEELQRALMQALAECGNAAGALLVYRQFRTLLWREVAAEPTEETKALFRRLREQTRGCVERAGGRRSEGETGRGECLPLHLPLASPRRLPLPLTPLIGRDDATREVVCRLAGARLVTLTGTGGIGKTRLALQVAEELADDDEAGAAFVDLAPIADPATVPEALRAALEIPPGDARQETIEALQRYLAPCRLLLVLDNCEHLRSACAALAYALLCQCPGLRILATSRQALGLRGEIVWRVPSLSVPVEEGIRCSGWDVRSDGSDGCPNNEPRIHPPSGGYPHPEHPHTARLLQYAAVRLFVERARAAEASFAMTPHNAPAIARVCRRLDGIPLAIELAAARVPSLSVEEIDAHLRDGFGLLTGGGPALQPRQQTLAATFDWSWDSLSPAEQTLLRRLSVFAGGWTLKAAEVVGSDRWTVGSQGKEGQQDGLDSAALPAAYRLLSTDVLDLLAALVDRSLVIYRPAGRGDRAPIGAADEGRYHLPETVRQYAADRLRRASAGDGGDERQATQNRHRDFFLELAEEIKPKLWGAEQSLWFRRLEVEHDNMRAALEECRSSGDAEAELRMAVALSRFWDTRGHLREGRAHLDVALARMAPHLPQPLRVEALVHAGWMAFVQGDYPAARGWYGQALALLREHGDQKVMADVLNFSGGRRH